MLQGAHVLTPEFVVSNPAGWGVVFGPAQESDRANVQVDAGELDRADDAPAVHRLGDGVDEAVRHAWIFYHSCLVWVDTSAQSNYTKNKNIVLTSTGQVSYRNSNQITSRKLNNSANNMKPN